MRGSVATGGLLTVIASIVFAGIAEATPAVGDSFSYDLTRQVRGTSGAYVGFTDELVSEGRYDVVAVDASGFQVHGRFSWTYTSSEGETDAGAEDRMVWVDLPSRRYRGDRTDLDEYDEERAADLSAWFWVDPTVQGARTAILDRTYAIVDRDVALGGRTALRLETTGRDRRDDDYGQHEQVFAESMWFDNETGWLLATRHQEVDTGVVEGESGGFELVEVLRVTDASWGDLSSVEVPAVLPPLEAPEAAVPHVHTRGSSRHDFALTLSMVLCGNVPIVFAWLGVIGALVWVVLRKRAPRHVPTTEHGRVDVALLPAGGLGAWPDVVCTSTFAPFLDDLVARTRSAGGAVVVATAGPKLVGLGLKDHESGVGTLFTTSGVVADAMQRHLVVTDFFAETRFTQDGRPRYNTAESYRILEVTPVPAPPYDNALIGRIRLDDPDEQAAVLRLAERVYGVPSARWFAAQRVAGDACYVARVDGRIVGFGLVGVVGSDARLHTGTVDPEWRNKGIGSELWRARLRAASALGAARVMVEIADWNLASLHLAREHGFREIGSMVVQTTRPLRAENTVVRR